jgi:transposase
MTKKKQHAYTDEFREKAIRLTKIPGRSTASVALELGMPAWKLRTWIQESNQTLERRAEVKELIQLQNEIKRLKEENEILKKAATYFAKNLQ